MTTSTTTLSNWADFTRSARLAAAALMVVFALPASAAVLFYADFEAPAYSAGNLNGQVGWSAAGSTVQSTVVRSGNQALSVDAANSFGRADQALGVATDGRVFSLSVDLNAEAGPQAGLSVGGDTGFIGQVSWNGAGFALGNQSTSTSAVPALAGAWHHLELILDFGQLQISGFVDGIALGSLAISNAVAPSSLQGFQLYQFDPARALTYFDNALVQSIPVPATAALVLLGVFAVGLGRRRLAR